MHRSPPPSSVEPKTWRMVPPIYANATAVAGANIGEFLFENKTASRVYKLLSLWGYITKTTLTPMSFRLQSTGKTGATDYTTFIYRTPGVPYFAFPTKHAVESECDQRDVYIMPGEGLMFTMDGTAGETILVHYILRLLEAHLYEVK